MKKRLFLFLLLTCSSYASELKLLSYNMGQLRQRGVDLVPCTKPRLRPQVDAMFEGSGTLAQSAPFVAAIQEAWTKEAYQALKAKAEMYHLELIPAQQSRVAVTGTVIVTNLPVKAHGFEQFSRNKYLPKGILHVTVQLPDGKLLQVANVHTGYSDSKRFSAEHQAHIHDIGRFINQRSRSIDHFAIAGDFNAGPDMSFYHQRYDPVASIWYGMLWPEMLRSGLHHATDGIAPTWDTKNPLVRRPTLVIRAMNGLLYETWGWEEKTGTLDHVFADGGMTTLEAKTVLTERGELRCPGRDGDHRRTNLSDHYGVLARLETR